MKPIYRFERVNGRLEATAIVLPLPRRRDEMGERDRAIRAQFPAKTQRTLAEEYGLTQQQISRIVGGIRSGKTKRRKRGVTRG
jgi:Mor family transcriptional regulator